MSTATKRRSELTPAELAIYAIERQVDRERVAGLTTKNACNARLNRIIHWIEQGQRAGLKPKECVDAALGSYAAFPQERAGVRHSLLRAHRIARNYGCLTQDNLDGLRHGRSAVIPRGKYAGERLEIDHIIPTHHAPELERHFANLMPKPRTMNRSKSKRFDARELNLAPKLERAGLLAPGRSAQLASILHLTLLNDPAASVPRAVAPPSLFTPGAGASAPAGSFSDPRAIVVRVQGLTERMEDWERRAGTMLETSAYTGAHAAELTGRAALLLASVAGQAEEDARAVVRLAEEVDRWHERCRAALDRAREAQEEAETLAGEAEAAEERWAGELADAEAWLEQAREAEEEARADLHRAQSALDHAESRLADAESELRDARNRTEYAGRDSRGEARYEPIDTTPYERAVEEAEREVRYCEEQVSDAENTLAAAVEERRRAERRVTACREALAHAREGRAAADRALDATATALANADRAREELARARRGAQAAAEHSAAETAAAERMREHMAAAERARDAAREAAAHAGTSHAEARSRSLQGRLEMHWRLDQLRAFDAPMPAF